MRRQETAFVSLFILVLGAVFILDRVVPNRTGSAPPDSGGTFVSTGWYCPAPAGPDVESLMYTSNLGRDSLRVRHLAVGGNRESEFEEKRVESLRRISVPLDQFNVSEAVGVADAFGEASVADLGVQGRGKGIAGSVCSEQPWDRWFFASASTLRGEDHYLLVANPFREEAVARIRLLMPDRDVLPARLRNVVIPALSQVAVYLPDYLVETPSFGVDLSATTGRVVVSRYSVINRGGVRGISLDLGARQPSNRWYFGGGEVPQGGEEELILANPGNREALVEIVFPTGSEQISPPDLAELPIPAGRQVTVNLADHLPSGRKHGVVVTSSNSIPVVAERRTVAPVEGGRGVELVFGVPRTSATWLVPVGSDAGGTSSLAMISSGGGDATVRVTLVGEDGQSRPTELDSLTIQAGRQRTVEMTGNLKSKVAIALVEASRGAIAVESQAVVGSPYSDFAFTPGRPSAG